jgi:hypothetical protein
LLPHFTFCPQQQVDAVAWTFGDIDIVTFRACPQQQVDAVAWTFGDIDIVTFRAVSRVIANIAVRGWTENGHIRIVVGFGSAAKAIIAVVYGTRPNNQTVVAKRNEVQEANNWDIIPRAPPAAGSGAFLAEIVG